MMPDAHPGVADEVVGRLLTFNVRAARSRMRDWIGTSGRPA